MKTVYNPNHIHKKMSSFAQEAKQTFGALCGEDNGKRCCRDYWCTSKYGHSILHEVETPHRFSTSQLRIKW
jgi:hypothetical protein